MTTEQPCVSAMSAELGGWKPIATAPRDEQRVLLFDPMRQPPEMIGRWRGSAWWGDPTPSGRSKVWSDESGAFWMPLPPPPTTHPTPALCGPQGPHQQGSAQG